MAIFTKAYNAIKGIRRTAGIDTVLSERSSVLQSLHRMLREDEIRRAAGLPAPASSRLSPEETLKILQQMLKERSW